ncbi:class I SAM-dependent methyltransferase [candidate division CSSED10-310 bacterium]|uniref:Class I SAM-dependent methyltransferase n=1 Tax=candidate division CSSED10-310 bacterium TaxID=2855610 RepID=A0ABV6YWY8_UNCC1
MSKDHADFTNFATAYSLGRSGYPAHLIDMLMDDLEIRKNDQIVEFGAGTGLITRELSGKGLSVTALEPNKSMLALAPALPHVRYGEGSFEKSGLPGNSYKWAIAACAFDYSETKLALTEIHRILQDDGYFTIVTKRLLKDQNSILMDIEHIVRRYLPKSRIVTPLLPLFRYIPAGWHRFLYKLHATVAHTYLQRSNFAKLLSTGHFHQKIYHETKDIVSLTKVQYICLWKSRNKTFLASGERKFGIFIENLQHYLDKHAIEHIEMPYMYKAWSVKAR